MKHRLPENKILKPLFKRVDHRGIFIEALNQGRWESLIFGQMKKGAVMGNHYHRKTAVFFFLARGGARIQWVHPRTRVRGRRSLKTQEGIFLKPPLAHAIRFTRSSSFIMLKSRQYNPAQPDTYPYTVAE